MVGFQNQAVRAAQPVRHCFGQMSDIGQLGNAEALAVNAERRRLVGVVRYCERRDFSIPHRKRNARRDRNDLGSVHFEGFGLQAAQRARSEEDSNLHILEHRS